MMRHVNDQYVKKAQQEDLRSRSSFKLQEINEKYRFIHRTSTVIDLGAAPGGWSLIVSRIFSNELNTKKPKITDTKPELVHSNNNANAVVDQTENIGTLISIDLLPIKPIPHATIIQGDFQDEKIQKKILTLLNSKPIDVILSDMLQNTSGQSSADHSRSIDLCADVLSFADDHLSDGGTLLCKYLQGGEEKEWLDDLKDRFQKVKLIKPKSSRSESREMFVLAQQHRRKPAAVK
jgi:23S rRNA (uridine2552-2'-O)-methyltransferase